MRLVIALLIWIGAVAGALATSNIVQGSIHNGGGGSDPATITATDPQSMFHTANLARALATARSQLGASAQVETAAVYPGYLSLTAQKGGNQIDFYVNVNGRTDTTTTPTSAPTQLFSLAQMQAQAPAAIAARITAAADVPMSQLHYMVAIVDPVTNHFQWLVYPIDGTTVEYFQAAGASGPLLEYPTNSTTGLKQISG
jgi:hypothetical protein